MLFFRSYFFKGSETDLNKLVKQLALNSTRVTLESSQANSKKIEGGDYLFAIDLVGSCWRMEDFNAISRLYKKKIQKDKRYLLCRVHARQKHSKNAVYFIQCCVYAICFSKFINIYYIINLESL